MMHIRGLVVDDNQSNVLSVMTRLNPHFEKADWKVTWRQVNDPDEANAIVRAEPPFDLAVIDLLFVRTDTGDDEERGFELITEVRERSPHTFILAISAGGMPRVNLFEDAKRHGANKVTRRGEFTATSRQDSPQAVALAAMKHLLDNGCVRQVAVHADPRDPGVQSLLHEVGESTITQLYRQVLGADGHDTHEIRVSFLAPGASGAHVCAISAWVPALGHVRHVLKLSRALNDLTREAKRSVTAATLIPAGLLVRPHPNRPVGEVNGWYGLGAQLQREAQTLRTWLTSGPAGDQVEQVLGALFLDGLGPVYEDNLQPVEGCALDVLTPRGFRQRLILESLAQLEGALTRPDGCGLAATDDLVDDITAFVQENRVGRRPLSFFPADTQRCYSHGDLHGGNVLVYQGWHPKPILIDISEFAMTHWAWDPAELAVDLLVTTFDAGVESMFFTRFPVWRRIARDIGDLVAPDRVEPASKASEAAVTGLRWLMANIRRFCPVLGSEEGVRRYQWEWRVALAAQLLRVTYHDVPPPKRALAFVAAHDQLLAAERC